MSVDCENCENYRIRITDGYICPCKRNIVFDVSVLKKELERLNDYQESIKKTHTLHKLFERKKN